MNWLNDNWTKILGTISTMLSTIMALIANGSFEGLLDPMSIRWLSIVGIVVGAAITGVGFSNSSKERVAAAMETALRAQPPETKT
jgi:hypothetical protein